MQKEITNYKIRGLGNILDPLQEEEIKKVNIKEVKYSKDYSINNYSYKIFVFNL